MAELLQQRAQQEAAAAQVQRERKLLESETVARARQAEKESEGLQRQRQLLEGQRQQLVRWAVGPWGPSRAGACLLACMHAYMHTCCLHACFCACVHACLDRLEPDACPQAVAPAGATSVETGGWVEWVRAIEVCGWCTGAPARPVLSSLGAGSKANAEIFGTLSPMLQEAMQALAAQQVQHDPAAASELERREAALEGANAEMRAREGRLAEREAQLSKERAALEAREGMVREAAVCAQAREAGLKASEE